MRIVFIVIFLLSCSAHSNDGKIGTHSASGNAGGTESLAGMANAAGGALLMKEGKSCLDEAKQMKQQAQSMEDPMRSQMMALADKKKQQCMAMIMKALKALGQAIESMMASKGSGDTQDSVGYGNDPSGTGSSYNPSIPLTEEEKRERAKRALGNSKGFQAAKRMMSKIRQHGFNPDIDNQTLTMPDGTKLNTSIVDSPAGMANAGFSLPAIKAAEAKSKQIVAKVYKKMGIKPGEMQLGSGGGGGGSRLSRLRRDSYKPFNPFAKKKLQGLTKKKRSPSSIAGLYRLHGGQPVGVSGADIFEMVSRRYMLKQREKAFIDK